MLCSTFDLITQATSSHLFVFCFFNLIIVMIFMGSKHDSNLDKDCEIHRSKHDSNLDKDCEIHLPTPANDRQDIEVVEHSLDDSSEQATNASEVVLCVYETVVTEDSKASEDDYSDDNYDTDDKDENYEEGDDELRQRIEEFIAKVNREWRAEMLEDI